MKKLTFIIFIVVFGFLTVKSSLAANVFRVGQFNTASKTGELAQANSKLASRAAGITQRLDNISQDLKQRAQAEINRRLNFLNQLAIRINDIYKLSSAEKTDLQTEIQTQIEGLNTLKAKINGDTDNTTLKADVKSIVNDYYIFLFFRVKVNLLVAADKLSTTTDNFNLVYTKLQTRINEAQGQGNNVISLNALLSDMNTQLTNVSTQYALAEAELTPLSAQGYPGNKPTLEDAKTKIQAGLQDLKNAYQDATKIIDGLRGFKTTTPQATSSAT